MILRASFAEQNALNRIDLFIYDDLIIYIATNNRIDSCGTFGRKIYIKCSAITLIGSGAVILRQQRPLLA